MIDLIYSRFSKSWLFIGSLWIYSIKSSKSYKSTENENIIHTPSRYLLIASVALGINILRKASSLESLSGPTSHHSTTVIIPCLPGKATAAQMPSVKVF